MYDENMKLLDERHDMMSAYYSKWENLQFSKKHSKHDSICIDMFEVTVLMQQFR